MPLLPKMFFFSLVTPIMFFFIRIGVIWLMFTSLSHGTIFKWEYVDPSNPALGKHRSDVPTTDGGARNAVPRADLENLDLRMAYLPGFDLTGTEFGGANLDDAYLVGANLTLTSLLTTSLHNADLTNAFLRNTDFSYATHWGLTQAQFYSTRSYQERILEGVRLRRTDLTSWNFAGQGLTSANFTEANLANTDFRNANLSQALFISATMTSTKLAGADVGGAIFRYVTDSGFTKEQFYSTTSYQTRDLRNIRLEDCALYEWDFNGADLTGSSFGGSYLKNTNFTGAKIGGAIFSYSQEFSAEQLYSTASYQARDLSGVVLQDIPLAGWDFRDQLLTNAGLITLTLAGTDFSGADLRGASFYLLTGAVLNNSILSDGHIAGLDLRDNKSLKIRNYQFRAGEEYPGAEPIRIRVEDSLRLNSGSTLDVQFDGKEWNSTISFEEGMAVNLRGTLQLDFVAGVIVAGQIGRTIDLFDWNGVSPTGFFDVSSPYIWDLANLYTTGEVTLIAVPPLEGDFDGDRDVDGRDFLAWQRDPNVGSLAAWRANYGDSVSSISGIAVPEPASVLLAAIVLLSTALARKTAG